MTRHRASSFYVRALSAVCSSWRPRRDCRGDSVIMKNGIVYRGQGAPDRDNTLVYISDGLKRVVVRDSKIERIEANNAFRTGEKFQLVQPMIVHGGLDAQGSGQRRGRAVGRARPPVVSLRRPEV